jgi:hypothetical protein
LVRQGGGGGRRREEGRRRGGEGGTEGGDGRGDRREGGDRGRTGDRGKEKESGKLNPVLKPKVGQKHWLSIFNSSWNFARNFPQNRNSAYSKSAS